MTFETLEDLRLFLSGSRHKAIVAAQNSRENGYLTVAMEHQNEAALADKLLKELAHEKTEGLNALQIEGPRSVFQR